MEGSVTFEFNVLCKQIKKFTDWHPN